MANIPEILREHRVKIVPTAKAETVLWFRFNSSEPLSTMDCY